MVITLCVQQTPAMHPDLLDSLTALPRRLRTRHDDYLRQVESMLGPGERVRAITTGALDGRGTVIMAATDRRIVCAGPSGWSASLPYGQVCSVAINRTFALSTTVTIHTAGTVLELRSPRQAASEFVAAVRSGFGIPFA
jgi:hypothetical protein